MVESREVCLQVQPVLPPAGGTQLTWPVIDQLAAPVSGPEGAEGGRAGPEEKERLQGAEEEVEESSFRFKFTLFRQVQIQR